MNPETLSQDFLFYTDVSIFPINMHTQQVLDLCSGISGFTLAGLISGGFNTIAFSEIDPYCQQVLNLRFPNIPIIKDVREITVNTIRDYRIHNIDGITAGFPCQPFSEAGKRKGKEDSRNLWEEIYRIVCLLQPRWCLFENVSGLLTIDNGNYFRRILWQLSEAGYDAEWQVLSASSVGAIHRRERIWIIAYARSIRRINSVEVREGESKRRSTREEIAVRSNGDLSSTKVNNNPKEFNGSQPEFCRSHDGISSELDRYLLNKSRYSTWLSASTMPSIYRYLNQQDSEDEILKQQVMQQVRLHKNRFRSIGNSIVPQCAAKMFDRVKEILTEIN